MMLIQSPENLTGVKSIIKIDIKIDIKNEKMNIYYILHMLYIQIILFINVNST